MLVADAHPHTHPHTDTHPKRTHASASPCDLLICSSRGSCLETTGPTAGPVTPLTQAAGLGEVQAVLGEPQGLPGGGGQGHLGGRPAAATALGL